MIKSVVSSLRYVDIAKSWSHIKIYFTFIQRRKNQSVLFYSLKIVWFFWKVNENLGNCEVFVTRNVFYDSYESLVIFTRQTRQSKQRERGQACSANNINTSVISALIDNREISRDAKQLKIYSIETSYVM